MSSAFIPRTVVNGGSLRQFIGKNVSIMLRAEDESKTNLKATSTDGQAITVVTSEPLGARKGSWIEVIGTPTSANELRAKEAIFFGEMEKEEFDEESYNMLVLFLSNCKDIFKHG